mmetsp:Transcript_18768/g.39071  ORF Transcript_18768/g.39071 Transcript_18768/m.39071 type:complete len:111 (+) Transcript_18768:504-836(+)
MPLSICLVTPSQLILLFPFALKINWSSSPSRHSGSLGRVGGDVVEDGIGKSVGSGADCNGDGVNTCVGDCVDDLVGNCVGEDVWESLVGEPVGAGVSGVVKPPRITPQST